MKPNQILHGNILDIAPTLPAQSVNCIVTSPPYYGLRDYGVDGQLGLEPTPDEYVQKMVAVFQALWPALRDDGTLWLNLGDSYANDDKWGGATGGKHANGLHGNSGIGRQKNNTGLPPKNLVGIPWRVALALQADGWYLRSDIIWSKPNPMPESVTDRPTKAHEYIFLLAKSERYYYDAEAVRESNINPLRVNYTSGKGRIKSVEFKKATGDNHRGLKNTIGSTGRNRRTVWEVATKPYSGAHFAVFPPAIIEPCILAGCPPGGVVLDPFFGSGTVGQVAVETGRNWLGVELNPEYIKLAQQRIAAAQPALIAPSGAVLPNNQNQAELLQRGLWE